MPPPIHFLQAFGWYPESAASLRRWKISSCRTFQPHLHAHPVSPEIPGVLSGAAVNMVSLTSLFVTGVYSMSSSVGFKLIGGSSGRVGVSGNRWWQRTWHFSSCVMAGGVFSPVEMGGKVKAFLFLVQFLSCHMFCSFASVVFFFY